MKKEKLICQWPWRLWRAAAAGMVFAILGLSAQAQLLGPVEPVQTADGNYWYTGSSGDSYCSVTDTNAIDVPGLPTTGIYATNFVYGTNVLYFSPPQYDACDSNSAAEGTSSGNNCDFRAASFPLNGATTVEISFYYYAPNVNSGDQVRVDLRMYGGPNDQNFVADENQHPFSAGTMSGWAYYQSGPITVPAGANDADIDVSINDFGDGVWGSGAAYFDDFLVTVATPPSPVIGPVQPLQTAGNYDWYTGASGASYNSVVDTYAVTNVPGLPTNGIYATNILYGPAEYDAYDSNSVSTAGQTGQNNCDFRAASFPLNGASTVDFSFYYYAANVNGSDQVRVDLRMYGGPNDVDFIADENQHPFTAGTMSGWAYYDSGPITVPAGANDADIDVSINDFGDGIWSSGAAYFDDFLVTIYSEPPVITQQPVSAIVNVNTAFTNTVVATGPPPLSYQWYENGAPVTDDLNNGTNDTLILSSVQLSDNSTNYYVVITNAYGAVTSSVVSLTVNTNLALIQDIYPTNITVFAGAQPTLSIGVLVASGAPQFGFQWYSNNVAIAGATSASYTLPGGLAPGSSENYYCAVTNADVALNSSVATVTIISDPTAAYPLTVLADNPAGFWRLNEGPDNGSGNDGVIAHDYWGGNNGIYTNVTIGQPGYDIAEPSETSVLFGNNSFQDGDVYAIPTNVDFSTANGNNSDFSIEAWVQGDYAQTVDAGLVSKGWGGGGEQFDMDCGNDTTNAQNPNVHSYRFFVRDAYDNTHAVESNVNPDDNSWHHLVGVCDESQGYVAFYIDGELVGTNTITPNSGILAAPGRSMLIGSRPSNETTNNNDDEFVGWIDDVAVYNYALSATQVLNQFISAAVPARVVTQPTNTVVSENGTATFSATVVGTPTLTNQWFQNGQPIAGATNTTLVLTDVQSSDNGNSYYLTTMNGYNNGTPVQSQSATLTVVSGSPQIYSQPPSLIAAVEGDTIQIPATAYGTLSLGYQWQYSPTNEVSWTDLEDNGDISGAQSNVLTIANAQSSSAGLYQLVIANSYGAVTSSVAQVIILSNPIGFNGDGGGWTTNQSGGPYSSAEITNGLLVLTDGAGNEDRSFFFNYPQYIGAFRASFTYEDVDGSVGNGADGASFCIQNEGADALGGGGGSLGVNGITPSAELEMNLYNSDPGGWGCLFATNGDTPDSTVGLSYQKPGNVQFNDGDPIGVTLNYDGETLSMTMVDALANTSFTTNLFTGNLAAVVGGDTAYVGFTGADGGIASTQVITNFTFVSLATEAISISSTNALISWSQLTPGYTLQENSDLTTTNWVNVTNAVQSVNGQNQVVVPAGNGNEFYRLVLP